jgi:hypothetical protein
MANSPYVAGKYGWEDTRPDPLGPLQAMTQNVNQTSARNIAEQSHTQKLINSQGMPPSGGSFGRAGYSTGLVPPGSEGAELKIPAYDEQKVEGLAQRVAAPGIRKLRDQVQQVQGGVYENPNVKAMTLRDALAGYGTGLENVMGGAFNTASGIYGQEYQPQVAAATTNYQGNLQRELQANSIASQERTAAANRYAQTWNNWKNNNAWA